MATPSAVPVTDFRDLVAGLERQWVVLSEDSTQRYGVGKTLIAAQQDARRQGYPDGVAYYVPASDALFCGAGSGAPRADHARRLYRSG